MTKKELIEYIVKQAQIITSQEKRNEVLSKELTKDLPINQSKLSTCCGIPIEEIPELVNKVEILQRENTRLGKTAYRRGRIIDEIEKYLKEFTPMAEFGTNRTYIPNDIVLDKLKELKENTDGKI